MAAILFEEAQLITLSVYEGLLGTHTTNSSLALVISSITLFEGVVLIIINYEVAHYLEGVGLL